MTTMLPMIAEAAQAASGLTGNFALGLAGAGAAIGVGIVGGKAAEAAGRNPGAFGKIFLLGILGMAFSEAIAIYALVMAFLKG